MCIFVICFKGEKIATQWAPLGEIIPITRQVPITAVYFLTELLGEVRILTPNSSGPKLSDIVQ
jgi:hypothetical protein